METSKVVILVPFFEREGGVSAVAHFLYGVLSESRYYAPRIISLASSSQDSVSSRLLSPSSWGGRTYRLGVHRGIQYEHFGSSVAEFEPLRYAPRGELTETLNDFDLVQVVAGHPAWALVSVNLDVPVALQVATLARVERSMKMTEGDGLLGYWRGMMTYLTHQLGQYALRQVDTVFVENQWMLDHVSTTAPSTETIFAPPGIDTHQYSPSETPFSERDYILSVGRFGDRRKNVQLLFNAYARLHQDLRDDCPPLNLAGRTPPPQEVWAVAEEHGVRENITFHADVSERRLIKLYRKAKLFMLSSDEEGLGLVILEAMGCGIPVVSTRCGGPETAVQDGRTGRLVPVGDAGALASAARELLQSPQKLKSMGENARSRAVNVFSKEATGERFKRVYNQLI